MAQPVVTDPAARGHRAGVREDPAHAIADLGRRREDHGAGAVGVAQVAPPPGHQLAQLLGQALDAGVRTSPPARAKSGEQRRGAHVATGQPPQRLGHVLLKTSHLGRLALWVRPGQAGVGQQVGHDGPARDRADRAQPTEYAELVQSARGPQVEQGGAEAAAGQAQGRPDARPLRRWAVMRGSPGGVQLGRLRIPRCHRAVGLVLQHPLREAGPRDQRVNSMPTRR